MHSSATTSSLSSTTLTSASEQRTIVEIADAVTSHLQPSLQVVVQTLQHLLNHIHHNSSETAIIDPPSSSPSTTSTKSSSASTATLATSVAQLASALSSLARDSSSALAVIPLSGSSTTGHHPVASDSGTLVADTAANAAFDELLDLELRSLDMLQWVLKKEDATWVHDVQRQAMRAILKPVADVITVMATGAGKSMLVIIPSLIEHDMTTVAIVPLKSLLLDYQRKLKVKSIPFEVWTGHQTQVKLRGNANLILVLVDQAQKPAFRDALSILHQTKPLRRIVFDEAHFALTNNGFREALTKVYNLRQQNCQIVLLSATIPPPSVDTIRDLFGLTPNTAIFRTSTNRPELQYIIDPPVDDFNALSLQVQTLLEAAKASFDSQDRAIVFVNNITQGQSLAYSLQCQFYSGSGTNVTDEQRQKIYQNWADGVYQVLVATSAFSTGNDYSSVRLVLHVGHLFDLLECTQGQGRAGRDHSPAIARILPLQSHSPPMPSGPVDHKGASAIWHMIFGTDNHTCIRFLITQFNDGLGILCCKDPANQICSRCQATQPLDESSHLSILATPSGKLCTTKFTNHTTK